MIILFSVDQAVVVGKQVLVKCVRASMRLGQRVKCV